MATTTPIYGWPVPTSTDYVKDGATAIEALGDAIDLSLAIPTYNAQTGTTYTFALTDVGKTVTASNASASTYTIPPQSSVVWVANTTLNVTNLGAGVVTFAGGVGVTVTNTAQTLTQYQSAQLIRTASNAWTVVPTSGVSSSPGLVLIKTQTIGSAVSSVEVTGAFSATYDNYRIMVSGGVASTNTGLSLQMGATTSGYKYSLVNAPYNASPAAASSGAGGNILYSAMMTTDGLAGTIDVNSPFLSKRTTFSCVWSSPSETGTTTGHLGNTTSYTAFTLAALSGNVTGGTIRVYGYLNS
jgi:hypothetical protein